MGGQDENPLDSVHPTRRGFIKKMAAAAFAVPIMTSFGMETLASAGGKPKGEKDKDDRPRQTLPNQACPNQAPPPGRPRHR